MGTNIKDVTGTKLYCVDENGNPIEIDIDFANAPYISVARAYDGDMRLSIDGGVSRLDFIIGEAEQEEMEESSEALDDFLNQFERK